MVTAPRSILLRYGDDDLDPDWISSRLGHAPTKAFRKGEPVEASRNSADAARGIWVLEAEIAHAYDADRAIVALFDSLSQDISVWREIAGAYGGSLLFRTTTYDQVEGINLAQETLAAIAERGLGLSVAVYTRSSPGG
jgi:hypothetical protein